MPPNFTLAHLEGAIWQFDQVSGPAAGRGSRPWRGGSQQD
jgi:hypothetical protein